MIYKIPIFNRIGEILFRTQNLLIEMHKQKNRIQEISLEKDERVKNLLDHWNMEHTANFGCVDKLNINGTCISRSYLDKLNTLSHISKKVDFDKIYSVFEIGGGFGSNIHLMLQNYKNIKKLIYLDIVPNLFVGTEYLRSLFGEAVQDYLSTRNKDKIRFSDNDDMEIICIAPWQIERLDVKKVVRAKWKDSISIL